MQEGTFCKCLSYQYGTNTAGRKMASMEEVTYFQVKVCLNRTSLNLRWCSSKAMSYSGNLVVQTEQAPKPQFLAKGYGRNVLTWWNPYATKVCFSSHTAGDKSTHKMHFRLFLNKIWATVYEWGLSLCNCSDGAFLHGVKCVSPNHNQKHM